LLLPLAVPDHTTPWATLLAAGVVVLASCNNVVVQTDISYDDRYATNVLDVYMPPPAGAPRPAVLLIHGGGWTEGIHRTTMAHHALRLAEAGYVTINIDYRLTPNGGQFPHAVQDCLCALSYVRGHAVELGLDPTRIAGLGYSAGGHLISMLGTAADDPIVAPDCAAGPTGPLAAVVAGAGPQDMAAMPQAGVVISFVGATLAERPELYAQASPITHVGPGAPPFLFVHGDNDWFVDIDKQTRPMKRALDDAGTETRLIEIPGGGHIWNRGANGADWEVPLTSIDTPEAQAALIDFLDHTIGPPP
jgi:acetyl esterase/lipase